MYYKSTIFFFLSFILSSFLSIASFHLPSFFCFFLSIYRCSFFSRGHATTPCCVNWSVGQYVRPSVHHIFEFQAIFELLLLPNHLRLDCCVSGFVSFHYQFFARDSITCSVRWSIGHSQLFSTFMSNFWGYCSCSTAWLVNFIIAPAHLHATWVTICAALFVFLSHFKF